jgi:hypothetical protein
MQRIAECNAMPLALDIVERRMRVVLAALVRYRLRSNATTTQATSYRSSGARANGAPK